jgi:hypothetical protein
VLAALPAGSADCIVTSPPYWAKRDYGVPGQYGHEPDPAAYVETLRGVFRNPPGQPGAPSTDTSSLPQNANRADTTSITADCACPVISDPADAGEQIGDSSRVRHQNADHAV